MDYIWPAEDSKEKAITIGMDRINLLTQKYGALSQDGENIYSRICIVNSCISLEPFIGCPLDCVYCAANNDIQSIRKNANNKMDLKIRKPELLFPSKELIDALIAHPAFIQDKSIISFCSGSTEVFHPLVEEDIWAAMEYMVSLGLKNPIWLVVKSFLSNQKALWIKRFEYLAENNVRVIVSISDAGLTREYEPYQIDNRFDVFRDFIKAGVVLSHHLRPLFKFDGVYDSIKKALLKSKNIVSSVCLGGLRYDPGMNYYWHGKSNGEFRPGNQTKDLPAQLVEYVQNAAGYGMPIFMHSSEMISHYLGISDYALHQYRVDSMEVAINCHNLHVAYEDKKCICTEIENIAKGIGLNLHFELENNIAFVKETINTQAKNALYQAIGLSDFWQSVVCLKR